jgi:hypothetical protein
MGQGRRQCPTMDHAHPEGRRIRWSQGGRAWTVSRTDAETRHGCDATPMSAWHNQEWVQHREREYALGHGRRISPNARDRTSFSGVDNRRS